MSELRYQLLDLALQRKILPDAVLRLGSRWAAGARERKELRGGVEGVEERLEVLLERMAQGAIAEQTDAANAQHYELPPEFFGMILGPRRKYSGCLWPQGVTTLAQAEVAMLELTCERAQIRDGMRILDLGCGWGSLSLWLAENYPGAEIVGVSNSASQRGFIEARCRERGLRNLQIITADINSFEPDARFDRVVSIEMFEHMRNWAALLARVATWLEPDGLLFVHVFSHRTAAYLFEGTWASERFFTAGLMPSHELMSRFQDDFVLRRRWAVAGWHYALTLRAWLANFDANRERLLALLIADGRTRAQALTMLGGWRLFLISTAETWARKSGDSWMVSHYLLAPRQPQPPRGTPASALAGRQREKA